MVLPVDISAGSHQDYVEDCPLCCHPMTLYVDIDPNGEAHLQGEHDRGCFHPTEATGCACRARARTCRLTPVAFFLDIRRRLPQRRILSRDEELRHDAVFFLCE
jgi:hypothetical protein